MKPFPPTWYQGTQVPIERDVSYAIAWRPDGIYFVVKIIDASRIPAINNEDNWCGDGAELFVDSDGRYAAPPEYDNPGTRHFVIAAPATGAAPAFRGEVWVSGATKAGSWSSSRFGAFPTPDGYVVEAFVVGADLGVPAWSLQSGATVGLDLAINVSTPERQPGFCLSRHTQYYLRATASPNCGLPFCDVAAFCTPTLSP